MVVAVDGVELARGGGGPRCMTPSGRARSDRLKIEIDTMRRTAANAKNTEKGKKTMQQTSNLRVRDFVPLLAPKELKRELPLTATSEATVIEGRRGIEDILAGRDDRMIAVVGPCSIHDESAALEYAGRLASLREEVKDALHIVMRVYFEKPRTRLGWRGLILDPDLDGTYEIDQGLHRAREILIGVTSLGLPAGSEMLDPIIPQYIDDLVSWASIGARTTESQTHREMASGLSIPVGL